SEHLACFAGGRQRIESESAMAALARLKAENGAEQAIEAKELDPVTGLPNWKEAERAVRQALASPPGKFVVLAVVTPLHAGSACFGYAVGDRILNTCAQHLVASLSANDKLFRWQGPAFLAILTRHERIDQVRAEVRRFADVKLEETAEFGHREVLIPI